MRRARSSREGGGEGAVVVTGRTELVGVMRAEEGRRSSWAFSVDIACFGADGGVEDEL